MKDEIKEIELDHFKDLKELKQNVENWIATDEMYWERWFGLSDIKTLLDYITNLQEERNNMACLVNDLQEKIDEAIELINQNICGGSISNANELINLLQGKSDE